MYSGRIPIAIDFDGVIHQYSRGWQGVTDLPYDPPMPGAKEFMAELVRANCYIIVFTSRVSPRFVRSINQDEEEELGKILRWFDKYGFEQGVHYHEITSEKVPAVCYVDDRAVRFVNWQLTRLNVIQCIQNEGKRWEHGLSKIQETD